MSRYTVEITFHRAQHVPVGDLLNRSSDPYIYATLHPQRPRQGRPNNSFRRCVLDYRTCTVRSNLEPTFECRWIVGGVTESGFVLELRLRDEDPGQLFHDDRLGQGVLVIPAPGEKLEGGWELREKDCKIEKRKGAFRSLVSTHVARLVSRGGVGHHTRVWVSVRVLGKSKVLEGDYNKIHTIGPHTFVRHFSPMIGFALKSKSNDAPASEKPEKRLTTTSFIANRLQLTGPVPAALRHRYVGYKPFIEWMFSKSGIKGRILHRALHDQYATIYGYGADTEWGVVEPSDDQDVGRTFAEQFLRMTSFGTRGRLFTYVITLGGEMRFTETGEELAIDLLSKHSMHADGAKEIAYSGEFFVRLMEEYSGAEERDVLADDPQDKDPRHYELVIDNDSGTYRPRKELLPILEGFLASENNFGGLGRVVTMDGFDETMEKWKEGRKETKKKARGKGKDESLKMVQVGSNSSMSSLMSSVQNRD